NDPVVVMHYHCYTHYRILADFLYRVNLLYPITAMTQRDIFQAKGFGNAAPWIDLANSEEWDGFGKRTEHLANPQWLTAFLKHWKLHPAPSSAVPRCELAELRGLLRRVAQKLAAGHSPGSAELSKLNQALKVPARQRLVQNQIGFRTELVPVKSDWSWVIAR